MADPFFDTNILIDWLLQRPAAIDELAMHPSHRISRIAWAEVLAGEPVETRPIVEGLLKPFEVVEVDAAIAALAADFRHRTRVKLLDALIYATAQRHGALLITRNTRDFPPGTPGVRHPYIL